MNYDSNVADRFFAPCEQASSKEPEEIQETNDYLGDLAFEKEREQEYLENQIESYIWGY